MKLVNAKCPICGGTLKVDSEKDAAICEFCGSPFIVQKAIENYNQAINSQTINNNGTINVENINIGSKVDPEKFKDLAKNYIEAKNFNKADEYINKALEIEPKDPTLLFLKARCLSYKTTEKIPPFSFLILSLKYSNDEKQSNIVKGAILKYLSDNCPVLDDSLLGELKSISKNYFNVASCYRRVKIKFQNRGKLIIDMDLAITLSEESIAEFCLFSNSEHIFYDSDMKTILTKIEPGTDEINFVYKASYFGSKIKQI